MKMQRTLTTAMVLGAIILSAGLVIANDLPTRGPIPFATWDADANGTIEEQEFDAIRMQRQAAVKTDNRLGRNMAAAPTFAQTDKNSDGRVTADELNAMQQERWNKKGMGR